MRATSCRAAAGEHRRHAAPGPRPLADPCCCPSACRLLGLEHRTKRGSLIVDYYGREVSVKILPTGVQPERLLSGFLWSETQWRRGELVAQFQGKTVLVGVDDLDVFKGIELKLQAFQLLLERQPEWREQVVLVQVANPARSTGKELTELREYVHSLVKSINDRWAPAARGTQPLRVAADAADFPSCQVWD